MSMRIYFRGDSRHPLQDNIFRDGMESRDFRNPPDKREPIPKLLAGGDADRPSGVAVTRNPYAAAEDYTPGADEKWIYFLALGDALRPPSNDYVIIETHKEQVLKYLNRHQDPNGTGAIMFWYAEEFVTKKIPGYDFIAAMRVKRSKETLAEYHDSYEYKKFTVLEHQINKACLVPSKWRRPAINVLLELFHIGSTHEIPKMLDGIIKSDIKNINSSLHPTMQELEASWQT